MFRKSRLAFVFLLVLIPSSTVAATKKPAAKTAAKLPKGARLLQNVVIPGCPGTPAGLELQNPPEIAADPTTNVLSTTLGVYQATKKVPVYSPPPPPPSPPGGVWTCVEQAFRLQLYKNPVTGEIQYPGPTLRLRRASTNSPAYPGDSLHVLLENHLEPNTGEDCIWRGFDCPDCDNPDATLRPECCGLLRKPVGMECFHGLNDTNLHFHGLHISPQQPQDWVFLQLQPVGTTISTPMGDPATVRVGSFQYAVNPLPSNQAEGTYWYHPHKHGSTSSQVGGGMAGALIVEGPFDDWLRSYYGNYLREKVMVIQQIHNFNFNTTLEVGLTQIISTALPLINGQLVPKITMNPGEVQRWRMIGATIEADAQLEIDFNGLSKAGNSLQVRQIEMDGVQFSPNNYYCQPLLDATPCDGQLQDPRFQLSPGNRGDFLVRADPAQAGHELAIPYRVFGAIERQGQHSTAINRKATMIKHHQTRAFLSSLGDSAPALMIVYVCKPGSDPGCVDKSMDFPPAAKFPPLPPFLSDIKASGRQNVQFQVIPGPGDNPVPPAPNSTFAILVKGKNHNKPLQFNEQCAVFSEPIDPAGGEEWTISQNVNNGTAPFHVFHIHTNPFQLVSTFINNKRVSYSTCPPPPGAPPLACVTPIWEDSLTLPNNTSPEQPDEPTGYAVIRQRFEDYTGGYVLHCHFLGHEDRGMMLAIQTVCPQDHTKYSVTSKSQKECTFGQFLPALPLVDTPECLAAIKKANEHH